VSDKLLYISVLEKGENVDDWEITDEDSIIFLNAWEIEDATEFYNKYKDNTGIRINLKNRINYVSCINDIVKANPNYDRYVISAAHSSTGETISEGVGLLTSVISKEVWTELGCLDNLFDDSHYWLDYVVRAKINGKVSVPITEEALAQELSKSLSSWDVLKFGAKWSVPEVVTPDRFWEYFNEPTVKYTWKEEMRLA
jgi:hypothetical protein